VEHEQERRWPFSCAVSNVTLFSHSFNHPFAPYQDPQFPKTKRTSEMKLTLLQPYPHPFHKRARILLRKESIIREFQSPLSDLASGLDGVAQIVGSLRTPVLYSESVLADFIAED
jgi:hypothetical protein